MKPITLAALTFCGAILTSVACAQGYVGIGGGRSHVDVDCSGTLSCDKTDTAWSVFGGYMANPNLGVEVAYLRQGRVRLTAFDEGLGQVSATFKGQGYGLYAVAAYPMDAFSVFGKLGLVSAKVKLDAEASNFGAAGTSERHTRLAWGLGAGYEFTKSLGGRMAFDRVRIQMLDERHDADLWSLNLLYRF